MSDALPPTSPPPPSCVAGRTKNELIGLFFNMASAIAMMVIGGLTFTACPAIPTLAPAILSFAVLNAASLLIKHVYQPGKQEASHFSKKLAAVTGILLLPCMVWLAVITWADAWRFTATLSEKDPAYCFVPGYATGFIASLVGITIATIFILIAIGVAIKGKMGSSAEPPNAGKEADMAAKA